MLMVSKFKNLSELSLLLGFREFYYKKAENLSVFDFGAWCNRFSTIFSQLKLISFEFPCFFVEEDFSKDILENTKILILGYRSLLRRKASINEGIILEKLNPKEIQEIYFGNSTLKNEEEFKERLNILTSLKKLTSLSITFTLKNFSEELFEYFCLSLSKMTQLKRLVCRFEGYAVDIKRWKLKVEKVLMGMKHLSSGLVIWRNGTLEFQRP